MEQWANGTVEQPGYNFNSSNAFVQEKDDIFVRSLMHDIEPYTRWQTVYSSAHDERSPFYGRVYDEFYYTQKVYNYYIHPQWDDFGSQTLYAKQLFADYEESYAILELIGEWNDAIYNDVMYLKREVIDPLVDEGIAKFILICENVLNFHGDDDCYYEEWYEDVQEEDGWICFLNPLDHVKDEMQDTQIQGFVHLIPNINWRPHKPKYLFQAIDGILATDTRYLNGRPI